ncbi:MAG: 3'-5' exonuclease [Verrucomicrobiota bacterium]|nr:3'-5' exonuclease [Verrucomicrobiota bacterium]
MPGIDFEHCLNPEQFQKTLRATREARRKPVVPRLRDGGEQARYVVDRIVGLRREGYRYSDMAILYRAHYHALEMELELKRLSIPYWLTSGIRFFEQAHVKPIFHTFCSDFS